MIANRQTLITSHPKFRLPVKGALNIQPILLFSILIALNYTIMNKIFLTALLTLSTTFAIAQGVKGYYQYPTLSGDRIIFAAESDLWVVPISGGLAQRITSHPGEESYPAVSPDGKTVAFTATYEGSEELYTMPLTGGLPKRWTYEGESSIATTWTSNNELVYTTSHYSTLPQLQLVKINTSTNSRTRVPLEQASEATYDASGKTVYFVRPAYHRNVTKRYKGGTARQVWKYTDGAAEAIKLTTDYAGESHHPMWWNGRIYFITDRDRIMNIWSITEDGKDLKQHTQQKTFDVRYASLSNGKIVYHTGADVWLYDITGDKDQLVSISLATDLDQLREKWVKNPQQYTTSIHIDPAGEKLILTARGRIFVAPVNGSRFVQASRKEGVRYRDANFINSKDLVTLSDESGEFELVKIPTSGIGSHTPLTNDGKILRFDPVPSPDGKWITYSDNSDERWLFNTETKIQKRISTNQEGVGEVAWSTDSKWLAFTQRAANTFMQIHLYDVVKGSYVALTTDRANSMSPCWSADGEWIYFISDRNFQSIVGSPWGSRQPEPYFDKQEKIYQIGLRKGIRSPFKPADELSVEKGSKKEGAVTITIDADGIQQRIQEVPIPAGNYFNLSANDKTLFFMSSSTGLDVKRNLMGLKISNEDSKPITLLEEVSNYELSGNGKKLLITKNSEYYVTEASSSPISKLNDAKIDLKNWTFSLDPKEDWKQLFTDAWRMERDYFYDTNMHGVDWNAMHKQYLPLVDRITTRSELSDLIGRFVGELEALHTSVRGGDVREGTDNIEIATLGARLIRQEDKGGYRIDYIYQADPDYPNQISPLAHLDVSVSVGDIITHVNGVATLSVTDVSALLRNEANKQVRLSITSNAGKRDVIVTPTRGENNLRYSDWEYTRRLETEKLGKGQIGYVHLRAMTGSDISQWYREFYPVFNRAGLIIDARSNRGGNIDSFILEKLMRKAWFYFKGRSGEPTWNMQYAFRGHLVVLVNENTASDGEAFADGFRRLGLGKVIGTRTWGGEIWLGDQNRLTDGGLARTPMTGVYGPERKWLIEGHGLEPDMEVDNLPHATFMGKDAQLEAAVKHLQDLIKEDPRTVPAPPPHPDMGKEK